MERYTLKNFKKSLLIAGSVMSIGAGSLGIASVASAATDSGATSSSIVDKLVAKFGLSKSDVQAVFDEDRTARDAERAQEIADKLAAAVTSGDLTQAQAGAITAKSKEMQTKREANKDSMESMTSDERKAAMESERAEFKQWMSDNDIPEEYARFVGGGRGHGGPGGPIGEMAPPQDTSTN